MRTYAAEMEYIKQREQRMSLDKLIEDKVYEHDVDTLKQLAIDKGYTKEWLEQQIVELNKLFLEITKRALKECDDKFDALNESRDKIKNIYYQHNYTATDYADLQFLQTLIKTRLMNEANNQPVMIERLLDEFIYTQKGARAITFLVNDNEVGLLVKPYYLKAAELAQTANEKRFNKDKAEELDKVETQIAKLMQTKIIGNGLLKVAEERVSLDKQNKINDIYFN